MPESNICVLSSQYEVFSYDDWKPRFTKLFKDTDKKFSSLHLDIIKFLDSVGIKTVIEESDYIDEDYSSAYSHFYTHFFRPPPKSCTRHLFFPGDFKQAEDIHDSAVPFKGFITVWPTCPPVIGRSVLPFPEGVDQRVEADYQAHVAGKTLNIRSAMFASKDHGVAVCASISTWLATDIMRRNYHLHGCSSTELTLLATGADPKWSRPLPQTRGLDCEQITRALTALDHGPYVYHCTDAAFKWRGLLYGYICSGIPIIILCGMGKESGSPMHAILAVGLRTRKIGASEGSVGLSFSKTVKDFIVHDDRYGAFAALEPSGDDGISATLLYHNNEPQDVTIQDLIVPLPKGVIVPSEHAHAMGISYLKESLSDPKYEGPYRTFLRRSTDFKAATLKWQKEKSVAAARIRSTPMPHWVWVTEAYESTAKVPGHEPLARVIIDSTRLRFDKENLLLAGHVLDEPLRTRIVP